MLTPELDSKSLSRSLLAEHRLLDGLLARALSAGDGLDHAAFEELRARLLRHIGVEEKILLPFLRARLEVLPDFVQRLRLDHAALAALLVPTPDRALAEEIVSIMRPHEAIEEGPEGLFALCDRVAGSEIGALIERVERAPEVPCARHFDGHGTVRTAAAALALAERARGGSRIRDRGRAGCEGGAMERG